MTSEPSTKNLPIGLGILNLTGLGLGYLYQKKWLRWGIHLIITIGLLAGAFFTNASGMPHIWLPLFGLWLAWMGFDGWRLGRKLPPEQRLFTLGFTEKQPWLLLVIPAILFGLTAAGLAGYYLLGQKEFQRGQEAYQDADCSTAVTHFQQVTTLFELTFNPQISAADDRLTECEVLLSADLAFQEGKFKDAIQSYQDYLEIDSEYLLISYTEEALATSFFGWAGDLMTDKDYPKAIDIYLLILDDYPDTTTADQVAPLLANAYLKQSTQLWESEKWQTAIAIAAIPLKDYPDTPAGKDAAEQIAGIYYDWASSLQKTNKFQESIEKYEIILKDYPSVYPAADIKGNIKSSYLAWGEYSRDISLFDEALEIYQIFQEEYPQDSQAADIAQLVLETHLEWGKSLIQESQFTQSMDKYTEIKDLTSDEEVLAASEEGYQEALWGLSQDTGEQGQQILNEAYKTACAGDPAPSPAVGLAKDEPPKARPCSGVHLEQDLAAKYPGHFQYVVIESDGYETVQTCKYVGGRSLVRQRQYWLVTVRSTITGNIYTSRKFYGSEPEKCQPSEWFSGITKYKYGTEPSDTEVETWLAGLLQ